MKKENTIENHPNSDENINKIDIFDSKQNKIKEEKQWESGSFRTKKESEYTNSLPLSFDIPEKEFSQQVKDNPNENSSFHQLLGLPNQIHNINSSGNLSSLDRTLSPFLVDVHRLSFNNMELNIPPGRALLFNNNNFESPYVIKTHQSQLSSSPLTIKISNSIKNLHDIDKDGLNNDFNCNSFFMGNHSSGMLFNSQSSVSLNPPNIYNGDISFYNSLYKNTRKKQNNKIKENTNILKYLDNNNQKELLERGKYKIKMCKNEKLIKSIFERKEESLTSSEENSRKILSFRFNSKSLIDSENFNQAEDPSSYQNTNFNIPSRSRIDPSKLLNNITYTLNNVNSDINIGYLRNFSFNNYQDNPNQNNYHVLNPYMNQNMLKEQKQEKKIIPEKSTEQNVGEMHNPENQAENGIKIQCNCKKSKCLKLYCDCFTNQGYCVNCNCVDCHNTPDHETEREKVILSIKEKNPSAFKPKVGLINNKLLKHTKGCNCSKSNCMKKYCECFQKGIDCSDLCRCLECKNVGHDKLNLNSQNYATDVLVNNSFILNNNESHENVSISFARKNSKDSKSICNYQIESESICLNPKTLTNEPSNIKKIINMNTFNFSNLGVKRNNLNVSNEILTNISNLEANNKLKHDKTNFKSSNPKSRLTERKRQRKNKKLSKTTERNKSQNKKDRDILLMMNYMNNLNRSDIYLKNQSIPIIPSQPVLTPKKNLKLLDESPSQNMKSKNLLSITKKNLNRTYEKKYRDTTLTHIVTTAPNTSKKRTSTIFNTKEFDKNIVKKLNMNVNNEPLFDLKNKK